jgi:hypothetical protein
MRVGGGNVYWISEAGRSVTLTKILLQKLTSREE